MYPLFETICVKDGVVQNLYWHQQRYESAMQKYYSKVGKRNFIENVIIPEEAKTGLYKLRVLYNDDDIKYEFEKYISKKVESLKLIEANSTDYELKYSDRKKLNDLFKRKNKCDDVLITKNGKITDTSYANIVFTDGEKWFTPTTPLLKGTCRARLLDKKIIESADISVKDLHQFLGYNLINAMNDLDKEKYIKIDTIL